MNVICECGTRVFPAADMVVLLSFPLLVRGVRLSVSFHGRLFVVLSCTTSCYICAALLTLFFLLLLEGE